MRTDTYPGNMEKDRNRWKEKNLSERGGQRPRRSGKYEDEDDDEDDLGARLSARPTFEGNVAEGGRGSDFVEAGGTWRASAPGAPENTRTRTTTRTMRRALGSLAGFRGGKVAEGGKRWKKVRFCGGGARKRFRHNWPSRRSPGRMGQSQNSLIRTAWFCGTALPPLLLTGR
jgi:hypothetical protein